MLDWAGGGVEKSEKSDYELLSSQPLPAVTLPSLTNSPCFQHYQHLTNKNGSYSINNTSLVSYFYY